MARHRPHRRRLPDRRAGGAAVRAIEGDQFTVLGMPLLPLLGALREEGVLIA
jgi:predicted house-cleaning NTP pyrophosphatase (Maf/HAM1 superfamily)